MRCCLGMLLFCALTMLCKAQTTIKPLQILYPTTTTYSKTHNDAFSFTANQAALAQIKSFTAGVYSEQRFLVKELNVFNGVVLLPTSSGNFGLNTQYFGNSLHNQMQVGLAYGRKLGSRADIGGQFNYTTVQTAGYGKGSAVNIEAGLIFHFTDQLHGGLHVTNPVSIQVGKSGESFASIYSTGFGYDASDKAFVGLEIEKTENEDINVIGRIQYKFGEHILARGGVSASNSSFYLGFGVQLKSIRLDATASVHQQLGFTPGLQIIFQKPSEN